MARLLGRAACPTAGTPGCIRLGRSPLLGEPPPPLPGRRPSACSDAYRSCRPCTSATIARMRCACSTAPSAGGQPLLAPPRWRLRVPARPVRPARPLRVRAGSGSDLGDDGLLAGKQAARDVLTFVHCGHAQSHVGLQAFAFCAQPSWLPFLRHCCRAAQQAAAAGSRLPPGAARCVPLIVNRLACVRCLGVAFCRCVKLFKISMADCSTAGHKASLTGPLATPSPACSALGGSAAVAPACTGTRGADAGAAGGRRHGRCQCVGRARHQPAADAASAGGSRGGAAARRAAGRSALAGPHRVGGHWPAGQRGACGAGARPCGAQQRVCPPCDRGAGPAAVGAAAPPGARCAGAWCPGARGMLLNQQAVAWSGCNCAVMFYQGSGPHHRGRHVWHPHS